MLCLLLWKTSSSRTCAKKLLSKRPLITRNLTIFKVNSKLLRLEFAPPRGREVGVRHPILSSLAPQFRVTPVVVVPQFRKTFPSQPLLPKQGTTHRLRTCLARLLGNEFLRLQLILTCECSLPMVMITSVLPPRLPSLTFYRCTILRVQLLTGLLLRAPTASIVSRVAAPPLSLVFKSSTRRPLLLDTILVPLRIQTLSLVVGCGGTVGVVLVQVVKKARRTSSR